MKSQLHIDWLRALLIFLFQLTEYARLHGYDLFVDYESNSPRGTTWLKFDMVERVIKADQHDWIWYLDFDTLITNTSISLTNLIDENLSNVTISKDIDLLVTDDW